MIEDLLHFAVTRRAYGDFLDELDGDAVRAALPPFDEAAAALRELAADCPDRRQVIRCDLAWLLYRWPWYPVWLDAQTYNAYTGRWDYLARNAAQTLALIR